MKKLTDAQVYTLRRMKNHTRYLLRGDGKKGDEVRGAGDHVTAPSLPVLFRLGLIEFVRGGEKVAGRYYDVQLTVAGLEHAVMGVVSDADQLRNH